MKQAVVESLRPFDVSLKNFRVSINYFRNEYIVFIFTRRHTSFFYTELRIDATKQQQKRYTGATIPLVLCKLTVISPYILFMTHHRVCYQSSTTGATGEAGTAILRNLITPLVSSNSSCLNWFLSVIQAISITRTNKRRVNQVKRWH